MIWQCSGYSIIIIIIEWIGENYEGGGSCSHKDDESQPRRRRPCQGHAEEMKPLMYLGPNNKHQILMRRTGTLATAKDFDLVGPR